jgi:hypothetical protein
MKKKICLIVAITTLLLLGVVIAAGVEDINKNNQLRKDRNFTIRDENGPPPEKPGDRNQKDNFTEITGIFEQSDTSFYIENIQLLFGPDKMITKQASPFDYDGDEIIETILGELRGLNGISISIKGDLQSNNTLKVCEINGMPFEKPPRPLQNNMGGMGDFGIEPNYNDRR